MKRYALRAVFEVSFLLLGSTATLMAAPLSIIDLNVAPVDTRNPAPKPAAEPTRSGNPLWAIPLKDLNVTRERPIFSPSRRPPPQPMAAPRYVPPPPQPTAPQRPQLALVGTVVNTREGFGIFFDQATNTVIRLKTGDDHNGWTLRSVQGREVTLQKDGETTVLSLPARNAESVAGPRAVVSPFPSAPPPPQKLAPRVHHGPDD